jgi:MSHA biogenesis protein MshJ
MNQKLKQIAERIDALSLRERAFIFLTAAMLVIVFLNMVVLDPQFAKQRQLAETMKLQQSKLVEIQALIQQKVASGMVDPDAVDRARLNSLKQQYLAAQNGLLDMQKGLISPEKMAGVLEDMLRRHGRLNLMSLKTLPVTSLNDVAVDDEKSSVEKIAAAAGAAIKDKKIPTTDDGAIYKHGVEITVQGGYLDMLNYMAELEAMPWQVFWGKAKLNVDEHPQTTLVLTLYTLSLDKKWLKL